MNPRLEIKNEHEIDAALHHMVREVEDRTKDGVKDGADAVGEEFKRRAKRLTGEYAGSFEVSPPTESGDKTEIEFGPTVPYAGKQERANHTLEESMNAAERKAGDALESAWRRGVS